MHRARVPVTTPNATDHHADPTPDDRRGDRALRRHQRPCRHRRRYRRQHRCRAERADAGYRLRDRPGRDPPGAAHHHRRQAGAAAGHQRPEDPRPPAGRVGAVQRRLRCQRGIADHQPAWLRQEPPRLHAGRYPAGRQQLRQLQRPEHRPRDHRREPGRCRAVAGHRFAGRGLDQQPGRHHPVLLDGPVHRIRWPRQRHRRRQQPAPWLPARGYR